MNETDNKRKNDKKKALIIFVILGIALVILPLLNMIDFNALLPSSSEDEHKNEVTTETLGDHHFTEPDYDEDIMLDRDYLEKNRYLHYEYDGETFEVVDNPGQYGSMCEFFQKYFDAAKAGDSKTYNSLFTEEYLEKNGEKSFAPQKIYNIYVRCIRSVHLKNGDAEGKYKGYNVYYFDVSYNILDNNGTLRNDFLGDEGSRPLVYEVIEGDSQIKISSVSVYSSVKDPQPVQEGFENGILIMVFVIALVALIIAELITKKSVCLCLALSCAAGVILALFAIEAVWVLLAVALISAVLLTLNFTVLKKYAKNIRSSAKTPKITDNINGTDNTDEKE